MKDRRRSNKGGASNSCREPQREDSVDLLREASCNTLSHTHHHPTSALLSTSRTLIHESMCVVGLKPDGQTAVHCKPRKVDTTSSIFKQLQFAMRLQISSSRRWLLCGILLMRVLFLNEIVRQTSVKGKKKRVDGNSAPPQRQQDVGVALLECVRVCLSPSPSHRVVFVATRVMFVVMLMLLTCVGGDLEFGPRCECIRTLCSDL